MAEDEIIIDEGEHLNFNKDKVEEFMRIMEERKKEFKKEQ